MRPELSPDDIVALNRLTLAARLLSGTAHDINNALMIIGGSAELLAGLHEMNDPARRAVDRIQTQASRAAGAIHELMQFARDPGQSAGRLSLRDVAARSVHMRGFAARRAGLTLTFDAAAAPQAMVHGNADHLQQAILNLIINAEQALQGTEGGAIGVELEEGAGDAILRILDNGRGIDAAQLATMFDAFATTRPVSNATGLGLAAARIIAQAHGGTVAVEARSPGCCATLRLPLWEARGSGLGASADARP
jgi:signal transduction histidine kinase